jgi:hypothetical protein
MDHRRSRVRGKKMKNTGKWLLISVLLSCSTGYAASTPCQLRQVAQIDVVLNSAGLVYVPVSINGHEGMMALQFSRGLPALYEAYIGELGLSDSLHRSNWIVTIGDRKVEDQARVASTLLGRANFTGWDYLVYPLGPDYRPQIEGRPVFGVMTSAFMNAVDLELNLGAGRMNLFSPNKCNGVPVYWDSEVTGVDLHVDQAGHLSFPMEVEGKKFQASLNTSGRLSEISAAAVSRYLGFDADSPGVERETLPGSQEVDSFRAMSLTAKGLEVRNSRIRIKDMPKCPLGLGETTTGTRTRSGVATAIVCKSGLAQTPFSIGTDLMKRLRIYVSVIDGMIYFTPFNPDLGKMGATPPAGTGTAPAAPD